MNTTYTYTKTISISDIYGTENPEIPAGFKSTGEFRIPKKGEYILLSDVPLRACFMWYDWPMYFTEPESDSEPRLILRKEKEYTADEVLDYVLNWINCYVPSNTVISNLQGSNNARTLIDRDIVGVGVDLREELKKAVIERMRKVGI